MQEKQSTTYQKLQEAKLQPLKYYQTFFPSSALESRTRKQERINKNTTAYCVENQRFAEAKPPFPTTAQTLFLYCVYI